jgi:hypothetical protein
MKTTMTAMQATDRKYEHVCVDSILTGDVQISANLNCTNNWEVLREFCPSQKCTKKCIARKSKKYYFYV